MTADIATLGIRIDARQVREADQALDSFSRTGERAERSAEAVNGAMARMQRLAAQVSAALGAAEIVKLADAWANLQGQLSLVVDGQERLAQTTDTLYQMAQRTRQGLKETVDLYARISRSTEALNKTDAERLRVTDTINKALVVSHSSTQASAAALMQLGQAFGANRLGGEELNSVLEQTPRLAQAIAEGMGKTQGDLKALAAAGKLTAEAVFNAIDRSAGSVDREFSKLPTTVAQAMTQVENALLRTVGVFDQQNQLSHALAGSLTALSQNMGTLIGVATTLAAVKLVNWLRDGTAELFARVAATDAAIVGARAQAAATVAQAETEVVATAATGARAAATLAAVQVSRLEATAQLASANANMSAARAAIASATAAGAQSFALRTLALATGELAVAEEARVGAVAALATLGQQQARVSALQTEATLAHAAATRALAVAQGTAANVAGWGARALGLLGGPLGLITLALGIGATAWSMYGSKAEEAGEKTEKTLAENHADIMGQLEKQIAKLEERNRLLNIAPTVAKSTGPGADDQRAILTEIDRVSKDANLTDIARQEILRVLGQQYNDVTQAMSKYSAEQSKFDATTAADKFKDWLQKHTDYLDKAGKIAAAITEAKKDLGDAFEPNKDQVTKLITDSFNKQDVQKEVSAYQTLIASIREKTAENRIEAAVGRDATESQKLQIKMDADVSSGKLKLSAAHKAAAAAALAELAASETAAKTAAAVRDLAKAHDDLALSQLESFAGLQVAVKNYGKISDARELDMIEVKNQAELTRTLADLQFKGVAISQKMRDELAADTDERTRNEQAIQGQTRALQYAEQLRTLNQQFAVQYAGGPQAQAAAQLAIDKAMWQSRISLAEEGTDAREAIETEYTQWLKNQQLKPQLDAQIAFWDDVNRVAHDTFTSIENGGKDMGTRLRDTLKNTLFAWLYEMTIKKWIIQVQAQVTGNSSGIGAGSDMFSRAASNSDNPLIKAASTASNIYKTMSGSMSSFGSGVASSLGEGITSLGSSTGSSTLTTFGQGMQGFGADGSIGGASGAGASAGGAVSAGANVLGGLYGGHVVGNMISGGYSVGDHGQAMVNTGAAIGAAVGSIIPVLGTFLGGIIGGAIGGLANRTFGHQAPEIDAQGIRGYYGGTYTSGQSYQNIVEKGGWFSSDRKSANINPLDEKTDSQITQAFRGIADTSSAFAKSLNLGNSALDDYTKMFDIKLTGDATKDQQLVTDFFKGVADEVALKLVPNLASFSQAGETSSATLERLAAEFQTTDAAAKNLGVSAADMFGSAGLASAASRERLVQLAGGGDSLGSLTANFSKNFLTDAERLAPVAKSLDDALGSLGLATIPQTVEQYKALVQSIKPTDDASAKLLISLLQLGDAFATVKGATDGTGDIVGADTLNKRRSLEIELMRAQGDESAAVAAERADELATLNESLRPLQQRVWALQDENALAEKRNSLEIALMTAQGNAAGALAAQRANELAALDASLRPMQLRVYALQDESAAISASYSVLEKSINKEKELRSAQHDAELDMIETASTAAKAALTDMQSLSSSLQTTLTTLANSDSDPADLARQRAQALAQVQAATATAQAGGPLPKADDLKDALSTLTKNSSDQYSDATSFKRDQYLAAIALTDLADVTDTQIDAAQAQIDRLDALKTSIDKAYNDQVKVLDDQLAAAKDAIDIANGTYTATLDVAGAVRGLYGLLGPDGAINSAYASALGRAPDAAGKAFYQNAAGKGTSISDIVDSITNSPEAQIRSMYQSILGRTADKSGLDFWMNSGASMDAIRAAISISAEHDSAPHFTAAPSSMGSTSSGTTTVSTADLNLMTEALAKIASNTMRTANATEDSARLTIESLP